MYIYKTQFYVLSRALRARNTSPISWQFSFSYFRFGANGIPFKMLGIH